MEVVWHIFKDYIWYFVWAWCFVICKIFEANIIYCLVKEFVKRLEWVSSFFNDKAIQVMLWILSKSTCTVVMVFCLVVADRDCGAIRDGLLNMYFICYLFRVSEYVIVSAGYTVKRGSVLVFENLFVYNIGAFFIKCSIF